MERGKARILTGRKQDGATNNDTVAVISNYSGDALEEEEDEQAQRDGEMTRTSEAWRKISMKRHKDHLKARQRFFM